MKHILQLLLVMLLFGATSVMAQTDQPTTDSTRVLYQITKTDGTEYFGYIISDDGREMLIETLTIGKVYITKSDIKSIVKASQLKVNADGTTNVEDYRNEGPFTTRYYLTTNALPIKKGDNYAMLHIYGPEVHFALSDNFSLGIMTTWIGAPMALAAKYSFNSKTNTHFAVGTIMGSTSYLNSGRGFGGLHWGTVTKGDRLSNISFSAGFGYLNTGRDIREDKYNIYYKDGYMPYQAENAIISDLSQQGKWTTLKNKSSLNGAVVLGLAGIHSVGKKASFIFDGMAVIGSRKTVVYHDYDINVTYNDYGTPRNETFVIGEGEFGNVFNTTLLIMPGMRFNGEEGKAFQLVLAGIFNIDEENGVTSIPLPMISWLRKF